MEGLNHTIWDEWGALPASQPVKDEAAGIIDGMSYNVEGEDYLFTSPRLFVVRRLMRLWGECEWSGPADGESIRLIHTQQRGPDSILHRQARGDGDLRRHERDGEAHTKLELGTRPLRELRRALYTEGRILSGHPSAGGEGLRGAFTGDIEILRLHGWCEKENGVPRTDAERPAADRHIPFADRARQDSPRSRRDGDLPFDEEPCQQACELRRREHQQEPGGGPSPDGADPSDGGPWDSGGASSAAF